jgi:Domain of unknown function (DUF4352)
MTDHQTTASSGITSPHAAAAPESTHVAAVDTTAVDTTAVDTTQTMAPAQVRFAAQTTAEQAYAQAAGPWFRKKRYALPSAVLLVFLVIMVTTGGNDPGIFDRTTGSAESKAEIANKIPAANLGQSVRDGKFAFVVTSLAKPSKTIMSLLGSTETAQGVFVIVRVNVTNIGYDARALTATDQFLISDQGQRFATSSSISSLPGAATIFRDKVNPGHTVNDAPMLFDVPSGTTIAAIELHDSVSSNGVKVGLS